MSQMTVSGAVSGLDTANIINQLVAVQTNQQTLLKTQQSAVQHRADAYASLVGSLSSLGSLASDLARTSDWHGSTATSSSTSVTATATGNTTGSLTFDVTALAAGHTIISTSTLSSPADVAAHGPLTLTRSDGTTTTIDVGTGSLSDVVSAVNSSNTGLTATAVRTAPGEYRLQVTSKSTGAASSFTLDGLDGFAGTAVLTQGSDARISVGTNPDTAYTVTSTTNTFSDLVPGLAFTVSRLESGVTVAAKADGNAIADKVSKLVDATNGILTDIASKTSYNATTKTGGPFTGETTVRSLQQNLLSAVSLSNAPGVSLTRDGKLTFDRSAFLSAYSADPTAVAHAFGGNSTFTAAGGAPSTTATVSNALKTARAGTYAVHLDSLATTEQWQVATGGAIAGRTLSLTRGTNTVSYLASNTDTLASTVAELNSRAASAGLGITASLSGTDLTFSAAASGSASAFTATLDGVDGTRLVAGADITGTIDGQQATGVGDVLSLASGSGGSVGLSLTVNSTGQDVAATGGDVGSLTYSPGLAQRLSTLVSEATTSSTGSVVVAEDGATSQVKRFQQQIDAWDDRLTAYRRTLTLQFTAMETSLARLKSATSALSQLTGASPSSSASSSSSGG
ncbi:MAG TPA: flagellar filament capping protein FliD [Kineosporiaceae bacterium]